MKGEEGCDRCGQCFNPCMVSNFMNFSVYSSYQHILCIMSNWGSFKIENTRAEQKLLTLYYPIWIVFDLNASNIDWVIPPILVLPFNKKNIK